jgi:hypothetical protein
MTKLKNGAKGGVFIVPSKLAIFLEIFGSFCFARNIGNFWKFWFARNYLRPLMGYLLSPRTWQFWKFLEVLVCVIGHGLMAGNIAC